MVYMAHTKKKTENECHPAELAIERIDREKKTLDGGQTTTWKNFSN